MSPLSQDFAHRAAVDAYGAFLDECVVAHVGKDRIGNPPKLSRTKIDGRPVRLVTISGKGGWSEDPALAERWAENDNISLLDHLLSVVRGALMFYLADAPRPWSSEADLEEIRRLAHAVACVAFLHDIDKDLGLPRCTEIAIDDVAERMTRYGINEFLTKQGLSISPMAMLNYIEEVEGTQASRSPAAPDYERKIAAACRYVELADKLEGMFTSRKPNAGVDGVLASLSDPNRWPALQNNMLKRWEKVEIYDHLHIFLLDRFQRALSDTCKEVSGRLPLIEIVHAGRLLCIIPCEQSNDIKDQALNRFLNYLPYDLDFSVNNRLACEFVGGVASWEACRAVMKRTGNWRKFVNLLALPRIVSTHKQEIDNLFAASHMATSWSQSDIGATIKPALEHPGGDRYDLDMEPVHALVFLVITLNHTDAKPKSATPNATKREHELIELMLDKSMELPRFITELNDGRARRVLLALWAIAEIWRLAETDPNGAQDLLDQILGRNGLAGLWLEGNDHRAGLASRIKNTSSEIIDALRLRFSAYLTGRSTRSYDGYRSAKRCILCNEPVKVERIVATASRAHGIKASAFSGRDGRNDHLSSPSGDTHLCLICLAELQLRQSAQEEFKGSGDLPPLISSPVTTGLFGGLGFELEHTDKSMGLNDLNRLEMKKGSVYEGLDCQKMRIRVARLEKLPNKDVELVAWLRMLLKAIQRLGRPIHVFCGAPQRHPAIFYSDALPAWLDRMFDGDSLRIEQLPNTLADLELLENIAKEPGLGIKWAKQLTDPDRTVVLGALCVAWGLAVDRLSSGDSNHAWSSTRSNTSKRALTLIQSIGDGSVNIQDNTDPLIRLAWFATRIQKRRGTRDSRNKQLLCWKTAVDFYPNAERSTSQDETALILGLAGTLEKELTRKKDAASKQHRDDPFQRIPGKYSGGEPLGEACITFAEHFSRKVWPNVFQSKEPTSQEQRRAAETYRFALLQAYQERSIPESDNGDADEGHT